MSDRIRNLEQAVQTLQSKVSSQPHPLLAADLLQIKSALGLYGGTQTGTDFHSSSVTPPADQTERDKLVHADNTDMETVDQLSSDESPVRSYPEVRIFCYCLKSSNFFQATLKMRVTR
jgi:hypothetical protein